MQSVPHKQCPRCYQIGSPAATLCTVCGQKLRTRYITPPPAPPPTGKRPIDAYCAASLALALGSLLVLALPLGIGAVVMGMVGLERRGRSVALAWWGMGIGIYAILYGLWVSKLPWF